MGPRILTVDDSRTIRMIVTRAFKPFACEILEASDGVEGLTAAQRERPDIILLDLTMPVMDGAEMLAKLKADPELRSIPVVMLTAESGRENVLRIAKMGVRDYLIKPFKEELVVERVGRIVDLKAKNEVAARAKRFDDPLQILVVDDKPAIVEQVQGAFNGLPWTVVGAAQAGQAVDVCSQTVPDAFLVSLSLPEGSGFILFQMLRASLRTKGVPVLALSVKNATEEQSRAQQLGFNGVITKPIDVNDLQTKISRALNLDTSYRYFQQHKGMLLLVLPSNFNQAISTDVTSHVRTKVSEGVDAGLTRLILDMSQIKNADILLIRLGIEVIQLCAEMDVEYALVGSEVVCRECKNYAETKDWQFSESVDQAMESLNDTSRS
jgi:two-component system, cell cycle response regulator